LYIYLFKKNTGTGLSQSGGRTAAEIVLVGRKANQILNHRKSTMKKEGRGREIGEREGAYAH
jgi:hypothetical protein